MICCGFVATAAESTCLIPQQRYSNTSLRWLTIPQPLATITPLVPLKTQAATSGLVATVALTSLTARQEHSGATLPILQMRQPWRMMMSDRFILIRRAHFG